LSDFFVRVDTLPGLRFRDRQTHGRCRLWACYVRRTCGGAACFLLEVAMGTLGLAVDMSRGGRKRQTSAKARGVHVGRPPKLTAHQRQEVVARPGRALRRLSRLPAPTCYAPDDQPL
jgi:hypothetical protein